MSFEIPKFNLGANALEFTSQDELDAALEKDGQKRFEPGSYALKVTNPRYHLNKDTKSALCAADPTWFNVAVTLESADGKSKEHYIQVPTAKVKYVGKSGKPTMFVYKKFVEFMAAVGESVTLNNLEKVVLKYFSSEDALKKLAGREVTVDMGYPGPYAEKVGEEYKIVTKSGDLADEDGQPIMLPDFASAKVYADSVKLQLTFVEVTKLHSNIKPVKTEGWE